MDIKKILAITIAVLALFACMNVASAGWFDFFGGGELANETYTFEGFTLDLPEGASMFNFSSDSDGVYMNTYYVSWGSEQDGNNESIDVTYAKGENMVTSAEEFVQNWVDMGAVSEGQYNGWSIINRNGVPNDNGGSYSGYMMAKYVDGSMYILMGDDLDFLKGVADSFKTV